MFRQSVAHNQVVLNSLMNLFLFLDVFIHHNRQGQAFNRLRDPFKNQSYSKVCILDFVLKTFIFLFSFF